MQSEIDKFKGTIQLTHDYYHAVEEKLIPEAPESVTVDLLKEDYDLIDVKRLAEEPIFHTFLLIRTQGSMTSTKKRSRPRLFQTSWLRQQLQRPAKEERARRMQVKAKQQSKKTRNQSQFM